ncbi:MAG: hypothetical protein KF783_00120 [Sphingomonas sp.]|nr:hypothetical protein [Sphingomonas sp.]
MLPAETVIGQSGLVRVDGEIRLGVRLPWYRSLPLSTVFVEALSIDGDPVDPEAITFLYGGDRWTLAELADQTNRFWFVLDEAFLAISHPQLDVGESHVVALTISIFPPYIPGMKRANPQSEALVVHERMAA